MDSIREGLGGLTMAACGLTRVDIEWTAPNFASLHGTPCEASMQPCKFTSL